MAFLKRVAGISVMGLLILSSVFTVFAENLNIQVAPDCRGIQDGVVVCRLSDGGIVYAECYDEKPLQNIGDNNTWQKNMPLWMKGLDTAKFETYIDKNIIKEQQDCVPLTFKTASHEQEGEIPMPRELPIEFLWIAVGLLILLIILMGIRHHKQCKEKKTGE